MPETPNDLLARLESLEARLAVLETLPSSNGEVNEKVTVLSSTVDKILASLQRYSIFVK